MSESPILQDLATAQAGIAHADPSILSSEEQGRAAREIQDIHTSLDDGDITAQTARERLLALIRGVPNSGQIFSITDTGLQLRPSGFGGVWRDFKAEHPELPWAEVPAILPEVHSDGVDKLGQKIEEALNLGKELAIDSSQPFVANDLVIQTRMRVIRRIRNLLPLSQWTQIEDRHPDRVPDVTGLYILMLENLKQFIRQAPHWIGVKNFAQEFLVHVHAEFGHEDDRIPTALQNAIATSIGEIPIYGGIADTIDDPLRVFIDSAKLVNLASHIYRAELADQLFHLSFASPHTERKILRDLHTLAFGANATDESRRGVVLLLREFIRLSRGHALDASDGFFMRDYSAIVGTDLPFYLLTTSTIFPPEEWSRAILQGLQTKNLNGQDILEMGTGSGFLSLYLARHAGVGRVWAYDKNPDSPLVARLNALLMSFDLRGKRKPGVQPIDKVVFGHTRHLYQDVPPDLKVDRAFGCLPQVPSQKELTAREIADHYPAKGDPEDKDGFGLVTEFIRDSERHLKPHGTVIVNMALRAGEAAIQHMASRQGSTGFSPHTIFTTNFPQDKTTRLTGYIRIEEEGLRPPFQFVLGDRIISATEAERVRAEYRRRFLAAHSEEERVALQSDPAFDVRHNQWVVEYTPNSRFFDVWKTKATQAVTDFLRTKRRIGYTDDTGSEYEPFREEMTRRLSSLMEAQIPREALFVGPIVRSLVSNLTWVVGADKISVQSLGKTSDGFLDDLNRRSEQKQYTVLVAGPADAKKLYRISRFLHSHPEAKRYVSLVWQNSDLPVGNAPLATMVLWNRAIYQSLAKIAEDTYSRVSTLQAVYETSLLQSRRKVGFEIDVAAMPTTLGVVQGNQSADVREQAQKLGEFKAHPPALSGRSSDDVIDLSFGESEFPISEAHLTTLVGALEADLPETDIRQKISGYLSKTGRGDFDVDEIQTGAGVHPLIESTLEILGRGQPFRVMIPAGSYGQFFPTIHVAGGQPAMFSIDPKSNGNTSIRAVLEASLQSQGTDAAPVRALLLPYPTNPAGLFYAPGVLHTIIAFCQEHGITILADEIFYGTASRQDQRTARACSIFSFAYGDSRDFLNKHLIGFTGLSKEFALGGARFGFAYSRNQELLRALQQKNPIPVDDKSLKLAHAAYEPEFRTVYLGSHLRWLKQNQQKMVGLLERYEAEGIIRFQRPEGGYFVEVAVDMLFGRTLEIGDQQYVIGERGENLREVLYQSVGVKVSPVGWSGNSHTVRFVYSIDKIDEALARLKTFLDASLQTSSPSFTSQKPINDLSSVQLGFVPARHKGFPPKMVRLKDGQGLEHDIVIERRTPEEAEAIMTAQNYPDERFSRFLYPLSSESKNLETHIFLARSVDGQVQAYKVVQRHKVFPISQRSISANRTHKIHHDQPELALKGVSWALAAYMLEALEVFWADQPPDQIIINSIQDSILRKIRNIKIDGRRSPVKASDVSFKGRVPKKEADFIRSLFEFRDVPSMYGSLQVVDQVPNFLLNTDIHTAIEKMPGPMAICLNHGKKTTRVVSVFIHGNEPSGFYAMLEYFKNPLTDPHSNIVFLVHNVRAAKVGAHFEERYLDASQVDLNRLWLESSDSETEVDPYVRQVQALLRDIHTNAPIEAFVDFHNSSGRSGTFSLVNVRGYGPGDSNLSSNMGHVLTDHVVRSNLLGTFFHWAEGLAPSIAIEGGQRGTNEANVFVSNTLRELMALPVGFSDHQPDRKREEVLEALLRIQEGVKVEVADGNPVAGVLKIRADIESFNIQTMRAGDWIAEWKPADSDESLPFKVLRIDPESGSLIDVTDEYIAYNEASSRIVLKQDIGVIVATLNIKNVQKSGGDLFNITLPYEEGAEVARTIVPQRSSIVPLNEQVFESNEVLSQHAASVVRDLIVQKVVKKGRAVLLMPTGSTPREMYAELVRMAHAGEIDFTKVTIFMLDEYVGGRDYHDYIHQNFFDLLPEGNCPTIHVLNGMAGDLDAEVRRYEDLIAATGGIDLAVIGVGVEGHGGFNERGSARNSRTRVVKLAASTLLVNRGAREKGYTHAITVGIANVLSAEKIILLANTASKAPVIEKLRTAKPHVDLPVSWFKEHDDFTVLLTPEAVVWENKLLNRVTREFLNSSDFNPQALIDISKADPRYAHLWPGVAVGRFNLTLEQHTFEVLTQFETYFAGYEFPRGMDRDFFRLFLALHDIGMPSIHQQQRLVVQEQLEWDSKLYVDRLVAVVQHSRPVQLPTWPAVTFLHTPEYETQIQKNLEPHQSQRFH